MRLRLGGKSYAPDPHCVLAQHCKGIGLFVDLMHKLQTVIEEVSNTRYVCVNINPNTAGG